MLKNNEKFNINGVILLDKDINKSSNKALQEVKRLFLAKKAGHTGSLDPNATGLLPICFGQATKLAQFLLDADKRYVLTAQLGASTNTFDIDGEITQTAGFNNITNKDVLTVIKKYIGEIKQIPPMFSALKNKGQPLYKLARKGIKVARKPRNIKIYAINFLNLNNGILKLDVLCSKGTYIRSLVNDIGEELGCYAYVKNLRRTQIAQFKINNSYSFDKLQAIKNNNHLLDILIPLEDMLPNLDSFYLDKENSQKIMFGQTIEIKNNNNISDNVRLFNNDKKFIAIGSIKDANHIAPKRLFV